MRYRSARSRTIERSLKDMVRHKLSLVLPVCVAMTLFAAACGPAASPAPTAAPGAAPTTGAAPTSPALAPTTAAAKPTTAAAGQATTAPAAQPTTASAAAQPTTATAAQPTTAPAASAAGKPVKGGNLTVAMERDASTFDPTRSQDVYSNAIVGLVGDSLYKIDDKAGVIGSLVEKTDNPQPNVYVLTLRKGIKFQDGTDLDSAAVKFNLERHINDPKSVRNQDVKDITSIETPDPSTVKITLKGPFAPFASKLAVGAGYILSPTAIGKLGDTLQRDLTGAGSGPYKFVSWQPDNQIVLERNPDYWGKDADGTQLPYLDRITFKPFPDENVRLTNVKTGDADVLLGAPPYKDLDDLRKSPDLTVKEIPGLGFQFIFFNTLKEPFTNPAVRRAVSYAIDREQIRQAVYFGAGKTLQFPVPEVLPWAYVKDNLPYSTRDVNKAKQELQSAGLTDVSFTFQISNNSPQLQQIAELMKDQLKDAGINMDIQLIEFATILQNGNSGEFQAFSLGWSGDVDPDGDLYTLLYTNAGFNFAKYSNPDFDKLVDDGRTNLDQAKRAQDYLDAQKILAQDQPMIVFYNTPQISVTRKEIQNYPQTYDGFWGVRDFEKIWRAK
jgi:peptide/nickel transport system substrate-binding protein